jgi:hypothetical protein
LLARLRDRDHPRESVLGSLLVLALPSVLSGPFGGGLFQMLGWMATGRWTRIESATQPVASRLQGDASR